MISKAKIKLVQSLKHKKYRIKNGLFVAEGYKTIKELLSSDIQLNTIFALPDVIRKMNVKGDVEIIELSEKELKKISFQSSASDVLGLFTIPKINSTECFQSDFLIVLDGVQDPGNLGTIIRLADWYDIRNIICSPDCADVFNPKVVQSTMGSIARVKVHYVDLPDFLQKAKQEEKYRIYGSFMDGKSIYTTSFKEKRILIMGNEGKGISNKIEEFVENRISIPAFFKENNGPESLNVAMATGIIVSEMKRSIML